VLEVAAEHRRDLAAAAGPLGASRLFDSHGMQPDVVLGVLDMLGAGGPARTLVVGCEPASIDYAMELSEPVAGAVDEAVKVILGLVAEAGRASQGAGNPGPQAAGPPATGPQATGPETAAMEDSEIPETIGEGVSHVPWHSR
jgi:hydrogenase maturation protease